MIVPDWIGPEIKPRFSVLDAVTITAMPTGRLFVNCVTNTKSSVSLLQVQLLVYSVVLLDDPATLYNLRNGIRTLKYMSLFSRNTWNLRTQSNTNN